MMESLVADSKRRLVVFDDALRVLAMKFDGKLDPKKNNAEGEVLDLADVGVKDDFYNHSTALFAYTSGTTNKPKGGGPFANFFCWKLFISEMV